LVAALTAGVLLGFALDRPTVSVPTAASVGEAAQGTDRLYGGEAKRYLDWLNEQGAKYVPTAGSVGGAAQGTDRLYGGEAERYLDWLNEQGAKYR